MSTAHAFIVPALISCQVGPKTKRKSDRGSTIYPQQFFELGSGYQASKVRHAISFYECMSCIEAYGCDVFEETTGVCREICNETNLQEFAQDWLF